MTKNYVTIQGWMLELNLKPNELTAYALIYGFSQDGETKFKGTLKYVCKWLNCTKPTAIKVLKELVSKNLIIKDAVEISGVIFNDYSVNLNHQIFTGGKETLLGGGKETLPHNTILHKKENYIKENELDLNVEVKKPEPVNTIGTPKSLPQEERIKAFKKHFKEKHDQLHYDWDDIQKNLFIGHYTQSTGKGDLMLFEDRKGFGMANRIHYWFNKNQEKLKLVDRRIKRDKL